jgi:hypothetical protein
VRGPSLPATTAREAVDDDAEERDDGVDDGLDAGGDGINNRHDAVADGAEDRLDLLLFVSFCAQVTRVRAGNVRRIQRRPLLRLCGGSRVSGVCVDESRRLGVELRCLGAQMFVGVRSREVVE